MNLLAKEHQGTISEWAPRSGYAIIKFSRPMDARKFKESKSKVYFGERQIQIMQVKFRSNFSAVQNAEVARRTRSYSCQRNTPTNLGKYLVEYYT